MILKLFLEKYVARYEMHYGGSRWSPTDVSCVDYEYFGSRRTDVFLNR
jgi:hypothetical protein